jgi:hypothetical protein
MWLWLACPYYATVSSSLPLRKSGVATKVAVAVVVIAVGQDRGEGRGRNKRVRLVHACLSRITECILCSSRGERPASSFRRILVSMSTFSTLFTPKVRRSANPQVHGRLSPGKWKVCLRSSMSKHVRFLRRSLGLRRERLCRLHSPWLVSLFFTPVHIFSFLSFSSPSPPSAASLTSIL